MNKSQPEYLITKDGFAFLVMGFTGKKAASFMEKYREKTGLTENNDIRDKMTNEEKKIMLKLQEANTGLLLVGMGYDERKEMLINLFSKYTK